ncbi:MAG: nuclear transport factor 2 family protein [Myxococcales bacterium]|nr:MAG: nuclear transport factor 2 family protein [Myxococcales bacterium]
MNIPTSFSKLLQNGIGFAGFTLACTRPAAPPADAVPLLIERSRQSNAALMQGDIERYQALLTLAQDFTLMSPFGGEPSRGAPTPEGMQRLGRFFKNGTLEQELVHAYGSTDLVVLALIERTTAEVGGLPRQPWALRVTLVYRRDGRDWHLVHRHADPLVAGISLAEAAELGRREPTAK